LVHWIALTLFITFAWDIGLHRTSSIVV
jgi:hypothetical protein